MRIEKYELFLVPPRWLFLRLETNDGLVGWGEPIIEGRARTVMTAVSEMMDSFVLGQDPGNIEDIWQVLYRGSFYRGGPVLMSALAGIDQALWDIKGKYLNAPIHQLLGGKCRDRVRVYAWIGGDTPENVANTAKAKLSAGFSGVKMNVAGKLEHLETPQAISTIVERFAKVRESVGPSARIAVDFHGRVSGSLAPLIAEALRPYNPLFLEEPVMPADCRTLAYLKQRTDLPIALGERLFSRWDFKPYLEAGVVDVIQPDVSHAGGITECKKIAACAEMYGATVAFHCPLGPIALAACLQVGATVHNYLIQETSLGIHYNKGIELSDYILNKDVIDLSDGYINIPREPGLGITIDEEKVREMSVEGHDWKNPLWRHGDASVAEW